MAIVKAMLETGILPDFIVVDGKEGGTGAAPVEFIDHLGVPLREGLLFIHNTKAATPINVPPVLRHRTNSGSARSSFLIKRNAFTVFIATL